MAQRVAWRNGDLMFNLRVLIASQIAAGQRDDAQRTARRLLQARPDFRLSVYAERCPFQGAMLEVWLRRLREAGLPD